MKKVYGYARISRDEDKKNYGSIETQKSMIFDYAKQNGWNIEKIFIDDDISGYVPLENRPAFYELYELIERLQEKPIILMKDWSRLSRNNGIAQTILSKWKSEDVELILVKEMGAPFNILKDNDDIVGITTWINERYVKETSKKVRDALNDRMKKGTYVSGPRYGYIKGKNGELFINKETANAVKTIFDLYEQGYGFSSIAKKLNIEYNFKTPSVIEAERFKNENKDHRNIKRNVRECWKADMISKILKDEIYVGTLVTHKKEVKGIHGKIKILPTEQNYRFENHHEPIISREQFEIVQRYISERTKRREYYKRGKNYYIFGGIIKCGECGGSVTGYIRNNRKSYKCLNYAKFGRAKCVFNSLSEEYILENFRYLIIKLKEKNIEILKQIKDENGIEIAKSKLVKAQKEYMIIQEQKIKELKEAKTELENKLIENTYKILSKNKIEKIKELEEYINKNPQKHFIDLDIIQTKQEALKLVNKIIIYKDKTIEFRINKKSLIFK